MTATATALKPAPAVQLQELAIALLDDSPVNPRKNADPKELAELAASIVELGIRQPLLVRPMKGRYEVVIGHRRKAAARQAGLVTVPALVEEMTDEKAAEIALTEQIQRKDLTEIEEADALRRLRDEHHVAPEELVKRSSKSRRWVYDRLKLAELIETGRTAILTGKMTPSVGLLVARLPLPAQKKAAGYFAKGVEWDGHRVHTVVEAEEWIARECARRLRDIPFSLDSAVLVPAAGACAACEKRVASSDKKRGDLCLDVACLEKKIDAAYVQIATTAKASGGKDLGKIDGYCLPNGYVEIDEVCSDDPKQRTWGELLTDVAPPPVVVARRADGAVLQGVSESAALKALKKAGIDLERERKAAAAEERARVRAADPVEAARRLAEEKERAEFRHQARAAMPQLLAAAEKRMPGAWLLRALVMWQDNLGRILDKRGLKLQRGEDDAEAIDPRLTRLDAAQLRSVAVECVLDGVTESWGGDAVDRELFRAACEDLGVRPAGDAPAAPKAPKPGKVAVPAKTPAAVKKKPAAEKPAKKPAPVKTKAAATKPAKSKSAARR